MKNRILACVFILTVFFSNLVIAEESDIPSAVKVVLNEPQYYSGRIEISGNAAVTEPTTLTVVVTVPDGSINENKDIFYIGEVKTDKSGVFSENFYMESTDSTGRYTVYIKGRNIEETECFYSFYTDAQKEEVINEINQFTTADDVFVYFTENTKAHDVFLNMEVLIERYLQLEDKYQKNIAEKVNEENLGSDTATEFINRIIVMEELNSLKDLSATGEDIYAFFKENTGYLTTSNLVSAISDWLGEEDSTKILSELFSENKYTEAESLIQDYEEKAVVFAFNKAKWVEMENLLEISSEYLGITNFETIKKHEKKSILYQALVEVYEKSSQISDIYKNAVINLKQISASINNSGSYGSSSGSSTSSKGNSGIPVMSVKNTQAEKDNNIIFGDLTKSHWAYSSVAELASKGIVAGDDKGNFNPDNYLTREEFVTMAVNAFGLYNDNAICDFEDVAQNAWYYKYVASAVEAGIISGVSDTWFGAGQNLTREDMTVILSRINGVISMTGAVKSFEDDENISDYAKKSVGRMAFEGMINGMGNNRFEPKAYTTRAQGAVLIQKCIIEG